jgi:hypothetical protein
MRQKCFVILLLVRMSVFSDMLHNYALHGSKLCALLVQIICILRQQKMIKFPVISPKITIRFNDPIQLLVIRHDLDSLSLVKPCPKAYLTPLVIPCPKAYLTPLIIPYCRAYLSPLVIPCPRAYLTLLVIPCPKAYITPLVSYYTISYCLHYSFSYTMS